MLSSMTQLSDEELLARVKQLATREREVTVTLIAHLAELDARRLYLAEGYSSLFVYCTQVLHLSEHAAYGRIAVARAARRFPVILDMLASGPVNLTTVVLLAAHLTRENHREILDVASHKSKREVEELAARLRPRPSMPGLVRRLPNRSPVSAPAARPQDTGTETPLTAESPLASDTQVLPPSLLSPTPAPTPTKRAVVAPLASDRYKIQFTVNSETYEKLRRAQDLLRHQIPDGDVGQIMDRALTVLLEDLARKKLAATDRPRKARAPVPGSRRIPAAVKREVWLRDGGCCAFVGKHGRRCAERGFLEFHHVVPHAAGSDPTTGNIQLRCRAHNGYESKRQFARHGPSVVREPRTRYSFQTEYVPMAASRVVNGPLASEDEPRQPPVRAVDRLLATQYEKAP